MLSPRPRRPRHPAAGLALALALAVGIVTLAAGQGDRPPLSVEDVVRAWVAGTPTAEIAETIATRPVDFDLSPEMLSELRAAGLPPSLVEAMQRRQAELQPPPPAAGPQAPDEPPGASGAPLTVTLGGRAAPARGDGGHDAAAELRLPARLSPEAAAKLGLDASPAPEVEDLAVFLVCHTADHVPDQWRSRSPLGRDFRGTRRHRMLAFHAAAVPGDRGKVLVLALPAALEARVEPDLAHDLAVGIALRIGGRYYAVAGADLEGVTVPGEGARLQAGIQAGKHELEVTLQPIDPEAAAGD